MERLVYILAGLLFMSILAACSVTPGTVGPQGAQGDAGPTGGRGDIGLPGHSSLIASQAANNDICPAGGYVLQLGTDLNDDSVLQTSETVSVAVICNGTDGRDGSDGSNGHDGLDAPPTAFTPVGVIDPCGTRPNWYNEVFLKLANGMVIASFSDTVSGHNTRFSVIKAGTYQTTDGDNCVFTIDGYGTITYENHHY